MVVFQGKVIRRVWHSEQWLFSVVDIIAVLRRSSDHWSFWKVMKHRLIKGGSEVVTKCNRLKYRIGKQTLWNRELSFVVTTW